jgi:enoyl-[acyl-carrier protein] reductase II
MNRVLAHTGAKYPIMQAPMGWIARRQLASAVSRAGGLGIIETSSGETEACKAEISHMATLGLPFGVNLPIRFLKDDAMLKFVCESGVRFVTTSAGSPAKFIAPLKQAGITVYHAVPTLDLALKCVDAGIDALECEIECRYRVVDGDAGIDGLVVEGSEGGGFKNPEEVSTLVLLQAIRGRVDVPLVAAGGICDGRGMAAAFALGAEAIQMGTRFVSCAESPVHANYKNAIIAAPATGTWVLNTKSTPCIRALKTDFTRPIHDAGVMPAETFTGIQKVYFEGDMNAAPALAGQSAGLIDAVKTAQQIIDETIAGFFAITSRLGALAHDRTFG